MSHSRALFFMGALPLSRPTTRSKYSVYKLAACIAQPMGQYNAVTMPYSGKLAATLSLPRSSPSVKNMKRDCFLFLLQSFTPRRNNFTTPSARCFKIPIFLLHRRFYAGPSMREEPFLFPLFASPTSAYFARDFFFSQKEKAITRNHSERSFSIIHTGLFQPLLLIFRVTAPRACLSSLTSASELRCIYTRAELVSLLKIRRVSEAKVCSSAGNNTAIARAAAARVKRDICCRRQMESIIYFGNFQHFRVALSCKAAASRCTERERPVSMRANIEEPIIVYALVESFFRSRSTR